MTCRAGLVGGQRMYLLDTNILSYWMRGDASVIERIRRRAPSELGMAAITLAEILYGIEKSPIKKSARRARLEAIAATISLWPFDAKAAGDYAAIRTVLERLGIVIGERDLQIAAIARANGFTVVTHNVKEFERVPGLNVEDWAASDAI